jgi:hypothetical protein
MGTETNELNSGQLTTIESKIDTKEMAPASILRAATDVLYVSPNGDNTDGSSWAKAYTTIQGALNAASTDGDDMTLILISPHTTNYDINTTGDPTWTGNYILKGSHKNFAQIKNSHASATSIMKFSGKIALIDLNFNMGTNNNGVILTGGGFRCTDCQFDGQSLTSASKALGLEGASCIQFGRILECDFIGEGTTHMTAIYIDCVANSIFEIVNIHKCKTGIQIVNADSDFNMFDKIDIGDSGIGFDIDAGNEQHILNVRFHHNTTNIDDEVGDHTIQNIYGNQPITIEPDDFSGVTLSTGDGANLWGTNTEVRAAATSTVPFRVVGLSLEASASEKFRIRLTADDGTIYFEDLQFEGVAVGVVTEVSSFTTATEYIFNKGTQIKASIKSESVGVDTCLVWLKIQEI